MLPALMSSQSAEESLHTKVSLIYNNPKIGSKSRAGEPQFFYDDPNRQMLKETGAGLGVETMQRNLSVDREYERIRN